MLKRIDLLNVPQSGVVAFLSNVFTETDAKNVLLSLTAEDFSDAVQMIILGIRKK